MSDLAILIEGKMDRPRAVRIGATDEELQIVFADGRSTEVPWWRLYRADDHGTSHRFRRIDAPRWELRVTSGADRALLAHIGRRRLAKWATLLHRFHALKVMAGLVVLAVTVVTHLPADLTAGLVPESAQLRLVNGVLGHQTNQVCHRAEGVAALRKLVDTLDSQTAATIELVPTEAGGYLVSSLPGRRIILSRFALTEFQPEALAALLAHELAHIRRGHPVAATIRYNGFLGTFAAVLEGEDRRQLHLQFSAEEERIADLDAMQMLRAAGIPLRPAAELFEQMRIASVVNSGFAVDLRDFHFGLPARAAQWDEAAQAQQANTRKLLTQEEADAIFNVCWPGQILPSQIPGEVSGHARSESPLGSGSIAADGESRPAPVDRHSR